MQRKYLKKENILTIPNLLSLIRILLIPFIIWLYCAQKAYLCTIIVIALSGFTDIIDGKIARKFNIVSDVGKVLDPVADKLTQATLVICLTARYPWMWALLALFAVKECLMLLWGYLTLKIHSLRAKNDFLFSFLVRMVRLPSDVASLYMGAVHVEYKKYLLGSLLGMLPHTITYPIMGMSIQDIRSPQFIISLCAEIAYILVTSAVYTLYRKKNKADQ